MIATQALAVNPNIRYGLVKNKDRDYFIIALDRVGEIGIRLNRDDFETQFEAPGNALYDMTIQHPLFSDRDLSVIPDNSISPSYGSGINIVSPMSCLHDLELAEQYYLNTEGFISKSGKFTGDLGNEFEHLNPYTEGNELVTELMDVHQWVLTSYEHEYDYLELKNTKERVNLLSLDSWFFKITEALKQKWISELAFTKFRPKLDMNTDSNAINHQNEENNEQASPKPYFNIAEELVDFNEWCISEKSYWGIPVPYFINKNTGKTVINEDIILHVAKVFK